MPTVYKVSNSLNLPMKKLLSFCLLFSCCFQVVHSQARSPYLVKDIVSEQRNAMHSNIASMVQMGSMLYFQATDGDRGTELWKSDGTTAGTVILKDILDGYGSSNPTNLTVVGSTIYFSASTGDNLGKELWKTDGTAGGTVLVKDLYEGASSSNPTNFMVLGQTLYFFANYAGGYGLWKSDGTTNGTVLLSNSIPPIPQYYESAIHSAVMNSVLYFNAYTANTEAQLWKTDGTVSGTILVKSYASSYPYIGPMTVLNSNLYFAADDNAYGGELRKSDGTTAGTVLVKDIKPGTGDSYITNLELIGSTLYFAAEDGPSGLELWKSDGTAAGTYMFADIMPGSYRGSSPGWVKAIGSTLYFGADTTWDGVQDYKLWKSDGTGAGTVQLLTSSFQPLNVWYTNFINIGANVYFKANTGLGYELYKTDGTNAGTDMVKDINTGLTLYGYSDDSGSSLSNVQVIGSTFYFVAYNDVNGSELWKSDGTNAGTLLVKDIAKGLQCSSPKNLFASGSNVYFSAHTTAGNELWKSDGTAAGTVLLKDINTIIYGNIVIDGSFPDKFTTLGNTVYFQAFDGVRNGLWTTDGTTAGTMRIKQFSGTEEMDKYNGTKVLGNAFYFRLNGDSLWKSDGTTAGTFLLKDFVAGANHDPLLGELSSLGTTLIFAASENTNTNAELWMSDGTVSGTTLLKEINPTGASYPHAFTTLGTDLYFAAKSNTAFGEQLWKTNGTEAGTVLIKNIGVINEMVAIGSNVFFSADEGTNGKELWMSDGTVGGTQLLKDIFPGVASSNLRNLTVFNSKLYFTADDGNHGAELWQSDGTASGTVMLKDIYPGAVLSNPANFKVSDGKLYFSAFDVVHGNELWQTDGTTTGTMLVNDIRRIAENSSPQSLVDANGKLFFMATDGAHGEELWSLGNCSAANPIAASTGYLESFNTEKQSNPATQTCFCDAVNNIIATVDAVGANPVSGNFASVVLIENTPSDTYVKKYYHILPEANPAAATARITLYFTQAEFDAFNALATVDLPTSSSDVARIANLRVFRSLNSTSETINPLDADMVWNSAQSRWEVTFNTTGFGDFAVITTASPTLNNELFEKGQLNYYPNPTNGMFYIEAKEDITSVQVFDILGKEMLHTTIDAKQVQLNLEGCNDGIYFVMVKTQNKTQTIKVIKK